MRFGKQILAIAIITACGCFLSNTLHNAVAAEDAVVSDADKVYAMSHRYANLPGWSNDGKSFHPTLVMAYIKSSIGTARWGETSYVVPNAEKSCLVISTTSAHHRAVCDLLEQLRNDAKSPISE